MYENILALIASLLFHVFLALALLLNLKQPSAVIEIKQYEVVDAVAIDESKLLATLGLTKAIALQTELQKQWEQQQHLAAIRYAKLKQEEQRLEQMRLEQEKAEELERLKKLEQEREILEQQHQQEQQRLAKLRQKQEKLKQQAEKAAEERKRLEQAKQAEAKKQAEQKRQAEKLRKQREAKRAREEALKRQREQEAKRQAELEEYRKKEAAKKAEIERQKLIARRQQAAREAEIKRQIDAKRKAAEDQRISRVISLIQQRVLQQWQRPANISSDLTCLILVKLAPDGAIIHVQVLESSGHAAFDSSAISAVYKASPLPIPRDLYDHFKTFTFTFRPQ
jgi:colicin import membrane protein